VLRRLAADPPLTRLWLSGNVLAGEEVLRLVVMKPLDQPTLTGIHRRLRDTLAELLPVGSR
jgi:hypothetical protein